MRQSWIALGLGLALASTATAGVKIGDKLEPFALKDPASGKDVDIKTAAGKNGTVLMFIATTCPISNDYNTRMAAIAKDYSAKGIGFIGINSNRQEDAPSVVAHAKENGFSFPVLKDPGNVQADNFGATVTPEIYVYDANWTLKYHGRIDDHQKGTDIKSHDLKNALDAVVAGKEVPVAETKAFGCTIKRVKATDAAPATDKAAAKVESKAEEAKSTK